MALLLSALCAGAQSSTEGKDFWVALSFANSPSGSSVPEPFIAISAKKTCQVTLSNPSNNWTDQPRQVQAGGWLMINNIPIAQWYDASATANTVSEVVKNLGIYVHATEEVSVFAAMRMEFSYDATNILPITALQSDYIIQDYPPYNSEGEAHAVFAVVADENNTVVDITPTTATIKGKPAGTTFSVTLNKGQVYQVVSTDKQCFSGTHVKARDNKKIAVFQGADFTQLPGGKSARDCLYEQAMPTDYWGREFVVTRSKEKDANRVRITAQEDGTFVRINGIQIAQVLSRGETYEFEMSANLATALSSAITKAGRTVPPIYDEEALYIQTSCPCAVYSYDVSSTYVQSSGSETVSASPGDPSMVWISPLEQRISKITFGACGTKNMKEDGHTNRHFVNIVAPTSDCNQVVLSSSQRPNIPLTFTPVPGNPKFSYARQFLVDTDNSATPDRVFTLTGPSGVIAHVYGSGKNESYAYSVGSAAVKRGVGIGSDVLVDGISTNASYCTGTVLHMNAQVGSDIIDKAEWDMGDGVRFNDGRIEFDYTYDSPGWYDLYATVYAHKDCPDTVYPPEQIHVAFRITIPETIRVDTSCYDDQLPLVYEGKSYYQSTTDTVESETDCDWVKIFNFTVKKTCLEMAVGSVPAYICGDEDSFDIPYTVTRGKLSSHAAELVCGNLRIPLTDNGGSWTCPMTHLRAGHYKNAYVEVQDTACQQTLQFQLPFDVLYPSNVFTQKWEDVLVVFNKENNGGYEFIAYQWMLNGMPIEGATGVYYYVGPDEVLQQGGVYSVLLTTKDGQTIQSCPQIIGDDTAEVQARAEEADAPRKTGILLAPGIIMLQVGDQQVLVR